MFHDLAAQHRAHREELLAAVERVLMSGRYVLGAETERLEQVIGRRIGAAAAVAVSSGTDALLAALMSLGVQPGDRVLTTPFSFVSSATAIRRVGARPVFADIDPTTFNLDPAAAADWFDEHAAASATVKAILPVHLFGQCADLVALHALAGRRRVALIEDAAQSFGATMPAEGRLLSAATVGDYGCFSFYPTKNLGAAGEAGMVIARASEDAARVRSIRNQGLHDAGLHQILGGNFRIDELQAALLGVKLQYLDQWTARRRIIALRYDEAFAHLSRLQPPRCAWGAEHHVFHQYVVRIAEDRDRLHRALATRGIPTRVYYPQPLHLQPCLADLQVSEDAFPHARRAAAEALALPIHPFLTDEQQERVIEAIINELRR